MPLSIRIRAPYVALAVGTIALGLMVHWWGGGLAPAVRDVLADGLWAAMMTWWVAALVPRASLRARAAVALAICVVVETSQRYHTPGMDALRRTTAGHLVLGSDFDPRDLAAYSAGVLAVVLLERASIRRVERRAGVRQGATT